MTLIGYARVSTGDQTTDAQRDALDAAGCARIFTDEGISGTKTSRPGLDECLAYLREGDTLVVWRLDRFGRSLKDLIAKVDALNERGVGFRSLHESIDTTTSTGRLVFHIFGALAEFERELIAERTKVSLAAARARGIKPGPKSVLSKVQIEEARRMRTEGASMGHIAQVLGVSRATLYRADIAA